jgi:hypothetical protein
MPSLSVCMFAQEKSAQYVPQIKPVRYIELSIVEFLTNEIIDIDSCLADSSIVNALIWHQF